MLIPAIVFGIIGGSSLESFAIGLILETSVVGRLLLLINPDITPKNTYTNIDKSQWLY